MTNENITLIGPTLCLKEDFYSLAGEFLAEGDARYRDAIADVDSFIRLCADEAVGRNLAPGRFSAEYILAGPGRAKDPRRKFGRISFSTSMPSRKKSGRRRTA